MAEIVHVTKDGYHVQAELRREWVWLPTVDLIYHILKEFCFLFRRTHVKLLFLSCGTEDPRYAGQLDLTEVLKQHQIRYQWYATPGVHEWKVWRHSLAELAQKLFQPTT